MATKTVDNGSLSDYTVSANSGAADDDTQRVILATDDPAVASLAAIATDADTLATSTSAVDTALGGTQRGVPVLMRRDDSLATLTPVDGDAVIPPVDEYGRQYINQAALAPTLDTVSIGSKGTQVKKSYNTTSQQTGADVWSPGSGKKIRVQTLIIGTYGTTAARLILWFGANADTTYSEGTDEALFKASFAPSPTVKPGAVVNFDPPFECATADYELHITTDAALSVDIVVVGFEE